jgi:hypothetical protein
MPCLTSINRCLVSDLCVPHGSTTREQLKREAGRFANEVGSYILARLGAQLYGPVRIERLSDLLHAARGCQTVWRREDAVYITVSQSQPSKGFEIFTAVKINILVFMVMTPCNLVRGYHVL